MDGAAVVSNHAFSLDVTVVMELQSGEGASGGACLTLKNQRNFPAFASQLRKSSAQTPPKP
jgi:hypothetical protein